MKDRRHPGFDQGDDGFPSSTAIVVFVVVAFLWLHIWNGITRIETQCSLGANC